MAEQPKSSEELIAEIMDVEYVQKFIDNINMNEWNEVLKYVPNKKKGSAKFRQTAKRTEGSITTAKNPQELRAAAERAAEDSRKMAKKIQVIRSEERMKGTDLEMLTGIDKNLEQSRIEGNHSGHLKNYEKMTETKPTDGSFAAWSMKRMGKRNN